MGKSSGCEYFGWMCENLQPLQQPEVLEGSSLQDADLVVLQVAAVDKMTHRPLVFIPLEKEPLVFTLHTAEKCPDWLQQRLFTG